MCLDKLHIRASIIKVRLSKRKTMWKVFIMPPQHRGKIMGANQGGSHRTPNMWLHEKDFRDGYTNILSTNSEEDSYTIGFHGFATRRGAKSWCRNTIGEFICKVQIRGIVATGRQANHDVIVAKEIKLPPWNDLIPATTQVTT